MTRLHDGVRQTMAWLHGWTGLLLGHVLYVIAFAGTLSVFKPEISRWMRPESAAPADPAHAIAVAVAWLSRNAPDAAGWYLTVPDARANTVDAYFNQGTAYLFRALDPVSGAPVPRATLGGEFFYRLHFELQLPYPWGRLLAALAAAVMLVALISGIVAHRRFFRDFFVFRPGKGQRSWLDAHNVLGVLSLPFHVMITLTGMVTLASLSLPWAGVAIYGSDTAALYRDISPGAVERAPGGRACSLAPVAPMLRAAARRCGGPLGRVSVANPGDAAAVVTAFCADATGVASNRGELSFDGESGRVLGAWIERRPAVTAYYWLYGLHMARFAPGLLRWLYFLGGAMLTLAIATGLVLWTVKRAARAQTRGNRVLERVNAGVILGVPIGAAAFLCANRLLALDMPLRAEAEVRVALVAFAVALVAALALPDRVRWAVLFAMTGVGALIAPLLGHGLGWAVAAWRAGDGALLGGDLLLVAAGLGCVAAAWRAR